MNLEVKKLVERITKEAQDAGVYIMQFIDAQDIDHSVYVDGYWSTYISSWGLLEKNGEWVYFETDDERGYVYGSQRYKTLEEAIKDVYRYLRLKIDIEIEQLGESFEKKPYPEDTIELMEALADKRNILRHFVDVEDINLKTNMLCINEEWISRPSSWGICWKNCKWIYFETDDKEGLISKTIEYEEEEIACKSIYKMMKKKIEVTVHSQA